MTGVDSRWDIIGENDEILEKGWNEERKFVLTSAKNIMGSKGLDKDERSTMLLTVLKKLNETRGAADDAGGDAADDAGGDAADDAGGDAADDAGGDDGDADTEEPWYAKEGASTLLYTPEEEAGVEEEVTHTIELEIDERYRELYERRQVGGGVSFEDWLRGPVGELLERELTPQSSGFQPIDLSEGLSAWMVKNNLASGVKLTWAVGAIQNNHSTLDEGDVTLVLGAIEYCRFQENKQAVLADILNENSGVPSEEPGLDEYLTKTIDSALNDTNLDQGLRDYVIGEVLEESLRYTFESFHGSGVTEESIAGSHEYCIGALEDKEEISSTMATSLRERGLDLIESSYPDLEEE